MMLSTARSTIDVCEVAPSECLEECCGLLNATRERQSDIRRFEWLYLENPDGQATVWLLRDAESGVAAGFTAALPRRMSVLGSDKSCWIGSDFSVLPQYRTLGLAVKLRRAAKDGIDAGRADFLYAHPNDRMAVIHARVGHSQTGTMIRLARPLRVGSLIADRIKSPKLGRAAGVMLDPIVRWTDRASWRGRRFEFDHLRTPAFDGRFDELFEREGRKPETVVGIRDAKYLNWRYAANPCYPSEAVLVLQGQELIGYAIFIRETGSLVIKDVFPSDRPEVVAGLLEELRRIGYRDGLQSVGMTLLDTSPMIADLKSQGFRRRAETSQMFTYCPPDRAWASAVADSRQWRLTVGDRDL